MYYVLKRVSAKETRPLSERVHANESCPDTRDETIKYSVVHA